ncbi:uncharacterized protein PSFLO_00935 [Pseudozyma flocculosa]|uniref:Uncharacterized protein n=1 Tax=Pseudozyma flocculosa TaxID=84751 RepID=A0A5C3ESZ4_9BASI|nr:uncharacterized protein PSFLO_00935 [Pseudozyma flocculosa]
MKIFIRYFCIVYKELTEVDLALKHQEILFKSDLEDEHKRARLLAIEWVMWWRDSVFDPNGCMASSLVGYGCRRPTVAGCLKYAWVDGRVLWLKVTMVDCLFCLKHLELCHTIVSDDERPDECCVADSTGVSDPTFDVKKTGLSTDPEPAFDDPAHCQPIFGWSLLEVKQRKANVLVFEFTTRSSLFSGIKSCPLRFRSFPPDPIHRPPPPGRRQRHQSAPSRLVPPWPPYAHRPLARRRRHPTNVDATHCPDRAMPCDPSLATATRLTSMPPTAPIPSIDPSPADATRLPSTPPTRSSRLCVQQPTPSSDCHAPSRIVKMSAAAAATVTRCSDDAIGTWPPPVDTNQNATPPCINAPPPPDQGRPTLDVASAAPTAADVAHTPASLSPSHQQPPPPPPNALHTTQQPKLLVSCDAYVVYGLLSSTLIDGSRMP